MIHDSLWMVEALSLDVRPSLSFPVLVNSVLEGIRGSGFDNLRCKIVPEVDCSLREKMFSGMLPDKFVDMANLSNQICQI